MSEQALPPDTSSAAAPGQQDSEHHPSITTRISSSQSSTNSQVKIILESEMAESSNSPAVGNASPTSDAPKPTEKSDILAPVKSGRKGRGKGSSTPPVLRRSTRNMSEKLEKEKDSSSNHFHSSQPSDNLDTKIKSRASPLPNSISRPSTANTSTSGRPAKRKSVDSEQKDSFPLTHDDSQKSTGTTGSSAKRQKISPAISSATPSIPTHSSKRTSSASEKNLPLPALSDQDKEAPSLSSPNRSIHGTLDGEHDQKQLSDSYDVQSELNLERGAFRDAIKESPVPGSRSPWDDSVPASPSSRSGSKRKASDLEENGNIANAQEANGESIVSTVEVAGARIPSAKKLRTSSSASSLSSRSNGLPKVTVDEASDGEDEAEEAVGEAIESVADVAKSPAKKRGRPASGRPAIKKAASSTSAKGIPKKAAPGRRKKTSEDARVQAGYDRMVELKKNYKEIAKGLKPALAMIADKSLESMIEDPKAHEQVPEFNTVKSDLDSRHNALLANLEEKRKLQEDHLKTKMMQDIEYSEMMFKCECRDIFDRSVARALTAFVDMYERGTTAVAEDDNVSVNENQYMNIRDLNAFNVPDDVENPASALDVEDPGTSTPLGKKSPAKKRALNNTSLSEPAPKPAPIAKHSLLAVSQEHEPSSMPPSRAGTPEPVDTGKFDEFGVHVPNKVKRGRGVEPNNRAIVKPWIDYDPWDIQSDVLSSKKKPKDQLDKSDYVYLDQTSFTSLGGGGYKLGTNRREDFASELIERHGLHPKMGIPIPGAKNPDGFVPPTDFSRRLDTTQPVLVVDVEETRPLSAGGTRKSAELLEPLKLSRSTSVIYAKRNFDDFQIRQNMSRNLDIQGAGHPSVESFATYDGRERDIQKAEDGIENILEASEIVAETEAKDASAAAAAAAASIAHKSSINAIVNSEDESVNGPASQVKKIQQNLNYGSGSFAPPSVPGFDAMNEAIRIRSSQAQIIHPQAYFYGPQARVYANQPREHPYQAPLQQPYVQHQAPIQHQVPQQPAPFNNGPHSQPQQQLHMHQQQHLPYSNGQGPQQQQHQMMQTLHPSTMAQIAPPQYYAQSPQAQPMGLPPRGYGQFSYYVPPQQRQLDQPHTQGAQSSARQHRELRPAPPQSGGEEWVNKHIGHGKVQILDAAHFYRNASPLPPYHPPPPPPPPPPPQAHYQPAFAWSQQPPPLQMQQQQQQQNQTPSQQHPLPPNHPPNHHLFASAAAEYPASNLPAHVAPLGDYYEERDAPQKSSQTQSKGSKRM